MQKKKKNVTVDNPSTGSSDSHPDKEPMVGNSHPKSPPKGKKYRMR